MLAMFRIVFVAVFTASCVCGGRIARKRKTGGEAAVAAEWDSQPLLAADASPLRTVHAHAGGVHFVRKALGSQAGVQQPLASEHRDFQRLPVDQEPVSLYEAFQTLPPKGGWDKMRARLLFVALGSMVGGTAMFVALIGFLSLFSYGLGRQREDQCLVRFKAGDSTEVFETDITEEALGEAVAARPSIRIVESAGPRRSSLRQPQGTCQQQETRQQRIQRLYGAGKGAAVSYSDSGVGGVMTKTLSVVASPGGPQYTKSRLTATSSNLVSTASECSEIAELGMEDERTDATYLFAPATSAAGATATSDWQASSEEEDEPEHEVGAEVEANKDDEEASACAASREEEEDPLQARELSAPGGGLRQLRPRQLPLSKSGLTASMSFGSSSKAVEQMVTVGGNRRPVKKVFAGADPELTRAMLHRHESSGRNESQEEHGR